MRLFRRGMLRQGFLVAMALMANGAAPGMVRAASAQECAKGFVEITAGASACGFALTTAGVFTEGGRTLADPLIASFEQGADGSRPIAAGKVVLFPASPFGRFRVIQACDGTDKYAICWAVFVLDEQTGQLRRSYGGK